MLIINELTTFSRLITTDYDKSRFSFYPFFFA